MNPSDIVAHLRDRCPSFARNVAAGINWEAVRDAAKLTKLCAYVVPTDEKAGDPLYDNVIVQELVEGFDVVVLFPQQDEAGYGVADQVRALRRELCRALVGWTGDGSTEPILYEGRSFQHTDRAKAVYVYHFSSTEVLGHASLPADAAQAETWQALELLGLPPLEGIDTRVDVIDPVVDKNLKPDGVGPDGRIEFQTKGDLPP